MTRLPNHPGAARIDALLQNNIWREPYAPTLEDMHEANFVKELKPACVYSWTDTQGQLRHCDFHIDLSEPGWPVSLLPKSGSSQNRGLTFNLAQAGFEVTADGFSHTASTGIRADLAFVQKHRFFCIRSTQKELRQALNAQLRQCAQNNELAPTAELERYLSQKDYEHEFVRSWTSPVMVKAWIQSLSQWTFNGQPVLWGLKGKMALPQWPQEPARTYFAVLDHGKANLVLTP